MTLLTEPSNDERRSRRTWPSFVVGAAQQKYLRAEDGAVSAAAAGYSHWYVDGSLEGERPNDWSPARLGALRRTADALSVRPIYHGNFKVPLASDVKEMRDSAVAYARREIDICAALGAPLILHGGAIVEPRSVATARRIALDGLVDALTRITAHAERNGVAVWLENLCNYTKNHPFYYVYTNFEEYEHVLGRVPNLSFIFDVSHAHVNGGNPVQTFEAFRDRIVAMAFSDNKGIVDSHMPLGTGTLDYRGLVKSILQHRWRGVLSFETRGSDLGHSITYLNAVVADLAVGQE